MKALVINETRSYYGFVIEVEQNRDGSYYDSVADLVYEARELQFQWQESPVDWSSFRREVAKDVLPTLIYFANNGFEEESVNLNYWTCRAIEWADALIEKLK